MYIFTYKGFRRKGFASRVLQYIIEEARSLNLSFIELSATIAGLPLYKQLGFTEKNSKYTSMILQLD
ncbi:MAG: GNAT family N-acetyltransferase [Clostridiales bacterium]|nr:GNAT family N-acetyltransferase [Clostridiales bacterium]